MPTRAAGGWLADRPRDCDEWHDDQDGLPDDPARHPHFRTVYDRLPCDDRLWYEYAAVCRDAGRPVVAVRSRVAGDAYARRLVVDFLTADAVAHLVHAGPSRATIEPAVRRAVGAVEHLLTPEREGDYDEMPDPYQRGGAPAAVAAWVANVRGDLLHTLAETGERVPAGGGGRRPDSRAAGPVAAGADRPSRQRGSRGHVPVRGNRTRGRRRHGRGG